MTRFVALAFWAAAYSLASLCSFLVDAVQCHCAERFIAAWRGEDEDE